MANNSSCGADAMSTGDMRQDHVMLAFVAVIIAIFGFIGNLSSIYLLQDARLISSFNRLLVMLAYFDTAYIFLFLLEQVGVMRVMVMMMTVSRGCPWWTSGWPGLITPPLSTLFSTHLSLSISSTLSNRSKPFKSIT